MKLLWRILVATLCITATVVLAADDAAKKPLADPATPAPTTSTSAASSSTSTQAAAEKRVAVVEAVEGEDDEDDEEDEEGGPRSAALYAQHRDAEDDDDEEEDQLALESIQEKDGHGHHHDHHGHQASYAPAPPQYNAQPQPYQQQSYQQPQTIPVPLPVPVHPASVVLPTLPKQQYNPPAQYKSPPPSPYNPHSGAGAVPPPPPPPQPQHQQAAYPPPPPPPQPQPQAAYSAQRPVYAQPPQQRQPAYQPIAPPPPPAAPQQASYQQQPPPPPPPPQQQPPPYQPIAPPPAQAYQPPPPPPPQQPQYNPVPEAAHQVQHHQQHHNPQPEATVQLPATAVPSDPWPAPVQDMPRIVSLDVKCEKNLMKVFIEFDKPFNGVIFSKGHYANANCVHLPAGLGRQSANFDVSINTCGTTGNTENGLYGYGSQAGSGTFFENTIIIQFDPQVQEVWDQARKLRCTWHDQYEKSVTFRPFPVDMLDVVRADFAGDNVGCWMQIQVGKGPWASEVSGLVKIGQTMTMVLAIKDDDGKFDMLVRNCMAHDGKRPPIQLVDQKGCVTRPKLMSRFTKIKNFGSSASVLSYAHFQAFKFPDSMEVHFQCTIQICRNQCPEQCADGQQPAGQYQGLEPRNPYASQRIGTAAQPRSDERSPRKTRDVPEAGEEQQDVGINRIIQVVSTGDLTFALEQTKDNTTTIVFPSRSELDGLICMTSPGFAATLVVLLAILIISCLLSAFLCIRHRAFGGAVDRSLVSAFANPAFAHKKGHF